MGAILRAPTRPASLSSPSRSVLIYNLPETIRESDISKLSFAVELAAGLYDRYSAAAAAGEPGGAGAGREGALTSGSSFGPGAMLWLIQRDFLQGKSAAELVVQVLKPVPNPNHDADVEQLNEIRGSLSTIATNSTGVNAVVQGRCGDDITHPGFTHVQGLHSGACQRSYLS